MFLGLRAGMLYHLPLSTKHGSSINSKTSHLACFVSSFGLNLRRNLGPSAMGRRAQICAQLFFVFLSLAVGSTSWGQRPRCQQLFQVSAIFDLAKLRQVINEVGGQESVLRSRLKEDFDQKLQQLLSNHPQNREQLLGQLREALRDLGLNENNDATDIQRIRQAQKAKIKPTVKLKKYLRTKIEAATLKIQDGKQILHPLRFEKPDTGVLWSSDERYVAIRPENLKNPGVNQPTQIFDLQTRLQISESPTHGFFAGTGHVWVTDADNQVRVTDIVSGKLLASFAGTTKRDPGLVTDKYAIVYDGHTKLIKYYSGEIHNIGYHYGICQSCDVLAYVEHGRIRLVRLSTGQDLGIDLGISGAHQKNYKKRHSEGFIKFEVSGKHKFIFLDDLVVRNSPMNSPHHLVIPGTHWTELTAEIKRVATQIFTNHDTGKVIHVVGELMSSKEQKMIFKLEPSSRWVEIDFNNGTQRKIPGDFDEMQTDRYLVKADDRNNGQIYRYHDLTTGQNFDFHFNGVVVPVPGTDLFRFKAESGSPSWLITLDNFEDRTATLNHAPSVRPGMSPKGTYFIAEDNGQIVILTQDRETP